MLSRKHKIAQKVISMMMAFAVLITPSHVFAEVISSFHLDATLHESREVEVTETILYDFGNTFRHGIIRTIPEVYDRNGGKYRLHFKIETVTMDNQSIPFDVSTSMGNRILKIGNPDKTIKGKHTYRITYSTTRAINDQAQSQEWYWNITGNENDVDILAASALIHLPALASHSVCYTGWYGSTSTDCTIQTNSSTISVANKRTISPGNGLTAVLEFPTDTFKAVSFQQQLYYFLIDNLALLSPVLVLLTMFLIWWRRGRDPRGRGTIIPQYEEPFGLKPAIMIALYDQHLPHKAITATILDLARRGYLKILFTESKKFFSKSTTFTLKKLKEEDENMELFEKTLFSGLFEEKEEIALSDIEDFYQSLQKAEGQIFDSLKQHKWFGVNPSTVRAFWIGIAIVVAVAGLVFMSVFGELMIVSSTISGIVVATFGWFMPRTTREGSIIREEIEGFKRFLSVTETERLKFHNAPQKKPELFERFLPAAIALGVETQWAESFKDLNMTQPAYIEGDTNTWNAISFMNMTSALHTSSASSIYHAPSSAGNGGSGFSGGGSGGGFGGGGTGSW